MTATGTSRRKVLQAAVARLEAAKAFDAATDATAELSRIFQVPAEQGFAARENPADENRRSH